MSKKNLLELSDFFTQENTKTLKELLIEFYQSEDSKFEYSFNEMNSYLNIELINIDEPSLIFSLFTNNDQLCPNNFSLEINQELIRNFNYNQNLVSKINFSIDGLGSISEKHSLFIKSDLDNLVLEIAHCRFSDFSLHGSYESLSFKSNNGMRLGLTVNAKEFIAEDYNPILKNVRGYFLLNNSHISSLKLIMIRDLTKIEILNSKVIHSEIRGCLATDIIIQELKSTNLSFYQNTFNSVLMKDIIPLSTCLVNFTNNTFECLFLENLDSKRVSFMESTYRKPKLQILFNQNQLQKIETRKIDWHYNSIIAPLSNKEEKIDMILMIKSFYCQRQDTLNEKLFKSFEKIWRYKSYNRRSIPLIFSYHSNRFGLSLHRPIILIILLIIIEFFIFYGVLGDACRIEFLNGIGDLSYLINPAHNSSIFTDYLDHCPKDAYAYNIITVSDNLGRIIMGYLIFQLIDSFRYKYNLGR